MIVLLVLDLSMKLREYLHTFDIFPTSFAIGFYDKKDESKPKTRRFKMITLD